MSAAELLCSSAIPLLVQPLTMTDGSFRQPSVAFGNYRHGYGLFCLAGVATDGVSSHNFRHYQLKRVLVNCWAELSQDTLNRAIDQLPKRLMMVIKAEVAHVEFHLD